MKNIYFTADVVPESEYYKDNCTIKLVHDGLGFKVIYVYSKDLETSCNICDFFINMIDDVTEVIDDKIKECVEAKGSYEEFTVILIVHNKFYCYSCSSDNILIFKKKRWFGSGYLVNKLLQKVNIFDSGFIIYKCTGDIKAGDYFLADSKPVYDDSAINYISRLLMVNNIFRRRRMGYKSNRELITLIKSLSKDEVKRQSGSIALVACNGRL